ncbi:hypothetical protein AB9P05_14070 [Roseivirga sp. BDSF3-8]|uniref:hypothetical protein n=1 Tax=Roseivirga sp. BDSF3-8 TaxID=3241598 RepID=UPI0035320281
MKNRLKLEDISLKSFVTAEPIEKTQLLKGGIDETEWCSREIWACDKTIIRG